MHSIFCEVHTEPLTSATVTGIHIAFPAWWSSWQITLSAPIPLFFITPISLITYGHFIRKTTMSSSTPADFWCTVTSTCLSLSFKETSQLCSVFPPQWTLILEFRHTSLWGSSRCFFRVSHQSLPTLSPKKAFFWWVFFRKQNKIW